MLAMCTWYHDYIKHESFMLMCVQRSSIIILRFLAWFFIWSIARCYILLFWGACLYQFCIGITSFLRPPIFFFTHKTKNLFPDKKKIKLFLENGISVPLVKDDDKSVSVLWSRGSFFFKKKSSFYLVIPKLLKLLSAIYKSTTSRDFLLFF